MLAVIQTGGKQYLVQEGQTLALEKLPQKSGEGIVFDALLISALDGSAVQVGQPTVSGAKVEAEIVEQGKAKKIDVVKFKAKVRYRRKYGHRQPFTKVRIKTITSA
ncbi:50S ribosomal protein L21 [Candidatus Uhrbacteria bacterium]|nr:50S ribosomal protein L21 [Candidatus Uhrbacteria bacterium]